MLRWEMGTAKPPVSGLASPIQASAGAESGALSHRCSGNYHYWDTLLAHALAQP